LLRNRSRSNTQIKTNVTYHLISVSFPWKNNSSRWCWQANRRGGKTEACLWWSWGRTRLVIISKQATILLNPQMYIHLA